MESKIIEADLKRVRALCKSVIGGGVCHKIERLGGLTNHTYHVTMDNGMEYVVRIPGDGTEELIVRADEKISTQLACELDIDARCLYFGDDGAKVTEYIPDAVTMSAESLREEIHIRQMAAIFKKLHASDVDTGVPFDVFDMAAGYEKIIAENNVEMYEDYADIKDAVMRIKAEIDRTCDINIVPCHNDALCENWVTQGKTGRMYLIDWEYAGMNDGIWDLADVSIEAGYDHALDERILEEYLGREVGDVDWKHFLANKVYVDYLWTLWAKARVPYDGQPMEDWADERYARLKNSIREYQNIKQS
ncbi:MAG: phosphotransferase family protein [Eubacterium sp.]|nr:phosphotransferase family protein [Eubacterium sp.]